MIKVRRRHDDDLPFLVEILRVVSASRGYPSPMPEDLAGWLAGARLVESWVALADGAIAGQVSLASADGDQAASLWSEGLGCPVGTLAVVKRLFVHPALERRGIGRLLLRTAVAAAHERSLWPVLDVVSSSTGPLALYEVEGFVVVGELCLTWPNSGGPVPVTCLAGPPPPARESAG